MLWTKKDERRAGEINELREKLDKLEDKQPRIIDIIPKDLWMKLGVWFGFGVLLLILLGYYTKDWDGVIAGISLLVIIYSFLSLERYLRRRKRER